MRRALAIAFAVTLAYAWASAQTVAKKPLAIDDYTRWRLLEGLDDVGITLSHADDIDAFEARRPSWKPATL